MKHSNDHDLLVKITTQVDRLLVDVKEIKDDTATRVDNLEREKYDRAEADRVIRDATAIHEGFEIRIKWLERIAYTGLGLIGALEFYFRLIK